MVKKRQTKARSSREPLDGLASRVSTLERDVHALKASMGALNEEMSALRFTVKQMDERTIRGERVMLDVQGEQRRMSKTIDRIAATLNVGSDETKDREPGR